MAIARAILEMGMRNDLHGKDYTKAAVRAVKDAMHHSSLHFLKSFDLDRKSIIIHVKIGVQDPKSVNINHTNLVDILNGEYFRRLDKGINLGSRDRLKNCFYTCGVK